MDISSIPLLSVIIFHVATQTPSVDGALCGVITTLSSGAQRCQLSSGSTVQASRPAPAIVPAVTAS